MCQITDNCSRRQINGAFVSISAENRFFEEYVGTCHNHPFDHLGTYSKHIFPDLDSRSNSYENGFEAIEYSATFHHIPSELKN